MKTLAEHTLNRALDYHIGNDVPFYENVVRPHSNMSNMLFLEAKRLYNEGKYEPKDWFEEDLLNTDIGEFDIYEERIFLSIFHYKRKMTKMLN